jgi:hypothetical protein
MDVILPHAAFDDRDSAAETALHCEAKNIE